MTTETKPPGKIYQAMATILNEIEPVKKRLNSQKHRVRGVDDAYNSIHPLLAKHKVFITCMILDKEHASEDTTKGGRLHFTRIHMRLNFHAEDGSTVFSEAYGEAFDSGDKAAGKAMSNAYKYIVFQTFCVPTEELADSDSDEPAAPAASGNQGEGASATGRGMSMDASKPAKANGEGMSADLNGPCADWQRKDLIETAQKIWVEGAEWKEKLKEILAKRGAAKLADLTFEQAAQLNHKLLEKLSAVNTPF